MGFLFVCAYVRESGCASFGPRLIFLKSSGDRGENWTGITASQRRVPVTHGETLPALREDARGYRRARGDDERDITLLERFHFSDDTLLERLNSHTTQTKCEPSPTSSFCCFMQIMCTASHWSENRTAPKAILIFRDSVCQTLSVDSHIAG